MFYPEPPLPSDRVGMFTSRTLKMQIDHDIEVAVTNHSQALAGIWKLIRRTQRDSSLSYEEREANLAKLFAPLSLKDVRQTFVMDAIRHDVGVSFRSSMAGMMRKKRRLRRFGYDVAPGSNDKDRDLRFGASLGLPTPRTLQHAVIMSEVTVVRETVIKPVSGANSRGVFFVDEDARINSIRSGKRYFTLEDAAQELGSSSASARWIVEEAIVGVDGTPARDFKVYMFYGVPGLFLEIDRSHSSAGRNRYAGYTRDEVRRDISPNHLPMEGSGVPPGVTDMARTVSLHSPVPFVRVDFLVGANGCYLGEVTPHPGNTYAGDLYEDIDRELGDLFLEAEARLFIDLYNGKRFDTYDNCYRPAEYSEA